MKITFNKIRPTMLSELATMLRRRGCRMTRPRSAIVTALQRSALHLSAGDIVRNIHSRGIKLGLTTVYRTLDLLVEMGLIVRHEFGDGEYRYELAEGFKEHHHHLVCTGCDRVIEYPAFAEEDALVARMTEILARRHRFNIQGHQFSFVGLCDRCQVIAPWNRT